MAERVKACPPPQSSGLAASAGGADFCDAFAIELPRDSRHVLEIYLDAVRRTPAWVHLLMGLWNRLARAAGLKDLGRMDALRADRPLASHQAGERLGIFTLYAISEREVILEDADRHLDVKLSVLKEDAGDLSRVTVTTVVHIHNRLGRLYMLPVAPLHKRIVPAVLARALV